MTAGQIADMCVRETQTHKMSDRAQDVALIAIACADQDMKAWRKKIKANYRARHPESGSIFLVFVLPLIISLVSNWLAKWLFKGNQTGLDLLKAEALNALD